MSKKVRAIIVGIFLILLAIGLAYFNGLVNRALQSLPFQQSGNQFALDMIWLIGLIGLACLLGGTLSAIFSSRNDYRGY